MEPFKHNNSSVPVRCRRSLPKRVPRSPKYIPPVCILSPTHQVKLAIPTFPATKAGRLPLTPSNPIRETLRNAEIYGRLLGLLDIRDAAALGKSCLLLRSAKHKETFISRLRTHIITGLQSQRRSFWRETLHLPEDQGYYYFLKTSKPVHFYHEITQSVDSLQVSITYKQRISRILNAVFIHMRMRSFYPHFTPIVATMHQVLSEEETFWAFVNLCDRYNIANYHWIFAEIDKSAQSDFPIWEKQVNTSSEVYAEQWIPSLFTASLPSSIAIRVLDLFLIDGWKAIIRLTLSLLSLNCAHTTEHSKQAVIPSVLRDLSAIDESVLALSLRYGVSLSLS